MWFIWLIFLIILCHMFIQDADEVLTYLFWTIFKLSFFIIIFLFLVWLLSFFIENKLIIAIGSFIATALLFPSRKTDGER